LFAESQSQLLCFLAKETFKGGFVSDRDIDSPDYHDSNMSEGSQCNECRSLERQVQSLEKRLSQAEKVILANQTLIKAKDESTMELRQNWQEDLQEAEADIERFGQDILKATGLFHFSDGKTDLDGLSVLIIDRLKELTRCMNDELSRRHTLGENVNELESRLSQAEAELKEAEQEIESEIDVGKQLAADAVKLDKSLSHLMDVAGKMAGFLEKVTFCEPSEVEEGIKHLASWQDFNNKQGE
jgi:DNA repair exonuclease SbcCD ATPase subunit